MINHALADPVEIEFERIKSELNNEANRLNANTQLTNPISIQTQIQWISHARLSMSNLQSRRDISAFVKMEQLHEIMQVPISVKAPQLDKIKQDSYDQYDAFKKEFSRELNDSNKPFGFFAKEVPHHLRAVASAPNDPALTHQTRKKL